MTTPLPPVRRIVTGTDSSGRSYIMEDGESPAVVTMAIRPGYRNSNIWRTLGPETSVDALDSITQHKGVLPPASGTVLRVHPGMHITDTVDYAILLQGELVAVMDEGETVMQAGDILIQRGTNHAWANRSDQIARIAFVLIDAKR